MLTQDCPVQIRTNGNSKFNGAVYDFVLLLYEIAIFNYIIKFTPKINTRANVLEMIHVCQDKLE